MRHFKPTLTLRLPADLLPRLNAQAERFPYANPHALGLHFLAAGLVEAECATKPAAPVPTAPAARAESQEWGKMFGGAARIDTTPAPRASVLSLSEIKRAAPAPAPRAKKGGAK